MAIKAAMASALLLSVSAKATVIPPDARAVLDRAVQATHAQALDSAPVLRMRGKLRLAGLDGTIESIEDLMSGRFRTAIDLGVVKQTIGFDGATPWTADPSGIVDPQESDDAIRKAANEAYLARRGYLRAGADGATATYLRAAVEDRRDFDVLRVTPRGGRPAELWIDRVTALPDRWIERGATTTDTMFFSDYRMVGGIMLPFRTRSSDGSPANDQVTLVESYTFDAGLPAQALDRPASQISDASVESGATEFPIEIEGGHIVLPVSINGNKPLPFILDSGATISVLTPAAAEILGIEGKGSLDAQGAGQGTASVSLARVKEFAVGGARLRDQPFAILALPPMLAHRGDKAPVAGLIGFDMLRRFVTRIDYAGQSLRFSQVRTCPATRRSNELPIVFSEKIPEVEASIEGVKGLWSIDTGSSSELTLFGAFAKANKLGQDRPRIVAVGAGGVGGKVDSELARFGSMQFGPYRLNKPYARIVQAQKGAFSSIALAGNIGWPTLRNFVVTLDYECRTMTLEPGADFGTEEPINRAGFTFTKKAGDEGLEVLHVLADGPAARAGIAAGDKLIGLNGKPASAYSYGAVRAVLAQPPGKRIVVQLERNGQRIETPLSLADPLSAGTSGPARRVR